MVGVLVLSDICLYREGLELVLRRVGSVKVFGSVATVEEVLAKIPSLNPPVILVDMAMRDAFRAVQVLVAEMPHLKLVALGVSEVEDEILACAEAGVAGYLSREGSTEDLALTVQAAARGELHCTPGVAGSLLRRVANLASVQKDVPSTTCLTARELRVLTAIERGLSNKEIARDLRIEVSTVKNHVHNILEKLKVRRRGEAAAIMRRYLGGAQAHST